MIIRKAQVNDAEGIAYVNAKTWQTTYHHILPESSLHLRMEELNDRISRLKKRLQEKNETHMYVCDLNSCLVGFVIFGPCREKDFTVSEIYALYVLEEHQGQGIGKALVKKATEILLNSAYKTMHIWALRENPNVAFYKSLGAEPTLEKQVELYGNMYPEVGFVYELNQLSVRLGVQKV